MCMFCQVKKKQTQNALGIYPFWPLQSKIKSLCFFELVARRAGAAYFLGWAFSDLTDAAGDNR